MIDFELAEFQARLERAQAAMAAEKLDALLFCTEAEVRYFSGFRTQFWQSPTRPWFLILPRGGAPVAVIPRIGADLMAKTWIEDIRTWSSPNPADDGVSLLAAALKGYARVGLPMGAETSLRMPLSDFMTLRASFGGAFVDCTALVKSARMVKSAAELAILRKICGIGSAAFARAPDIFHAGQPLDQAFRAFKIALLREGAEDVPYLAGAAGQGGYGDVISPPSSEALRENDVLMLDTGAVLRGYFCDFDRNFAIGRAPDEAKSAYDVLWRASEAGLAAARAGATCRDLYRAMHDALGGGTSDVGRYGHGLGMQLTEWPSICAWDETVLQPGMTITLEPSLNMASGKMMVHEENILITEGAPQLLSERAPPELPVI